MLIDESPPSRPLTASQMFALYPDDVKNQRHLLEGPDSCHWCTNPCQRVFPHDDEPLMLFAKSPKLARRPNNGYICCGCAVYRRKRTTITYLDESLQDGKCLMNYSWWIDPEGPRVIDRSRWDKDGVNLFKQKLVTPPNSFCFSIIDAGQINHVQFAQANDLCVIKADTPLHFTHNNNPYTYSIYELKEALKHGPVGREPGVRLLWDMIGEEIEAEKKRSQGRPPGKDWEKSPKTLVSASGLTDPQLA